MSAPRYGGATEAQREDQKGQHVSGGQKPIALPPQPKRALDGAAQDAAAGKRGQGESAAILATEREAHERQREGMRNERPGVAPRAYVPDRPGGAQLMSQQRLKTFGKAGMPDREARYRDLEARGPHGFADRIVVREAVCERLKASKPTKQAFSHGDRRSETRPRESQAQTEHYVRQEMGVDRKRRIFGPDARRRDAVIETSHRSNPGPVEMRHDPGQIVGPNFYVAVGHDKDIVARRGEHVFEIGDFSVGAVIARVDDEPHLEGLGALDP
jgi:hypothetical protein